MINWIKKQSAKMISTLFVALAEIEKNLSNSRSIVFFIFISF